MVLGQKSFCHTLGKRVPGDTHHKQLIGLPSLTKGCFTSQSHQTNKKEDEKENCNIKPGVSTLALKSCGF